MTKSELFQSLGAQFPHLSAEELEDRQSFYQELIDDHMENGLTEEEAVAKISVSEPPCPQAAASQPQPRCSLRVWETVLLILGSPIWFSLLLSAVSVVFSLFVSLFPLE